MSKEQQSKTAKENLLAHVAAIGKKIEAASEDELKAWEQKLDAGNNLKAEADKAADAEKANATKSTGVDAAGAADDQNARANANWPSKTALAASLVDLARRDAKTASVMLAEAKLLTAGKILGPGIPDGTGPARGSGFCPFDEDDDKDGLAYKSAAKSLVAMASSRTKTASDMMQMARDIMGDDGDEDKDEGKAMPPWLKDKIGSKSANMKVASSLVALAKQIMADDDADDEKDEGKEVAAALVDLARTLSEN